jgi:hypothetical protein
MKDVYFKLGDAIQEVQKTWSTAETIAGLLHDAQRIVLDSEDAIKRAQAGSPVPKVLRLAEIIEKLNVSPKGLELPVLLDFPAMEDSGGEIPWVHPTSSMDSYRGYYEDLAIGWAVSKDYKDAAPKAGALREALRSAVGSTYGGWKGGEFTMREDSRVWIANSGYSTGLQIIEVLERSYAIFLRTWRENL